MSDVYVLENRQEIFLRCTHINVHIIACLRAVKALDRLQVSELSGEKSLIKRSQMVSDWIEESQACYNRFLKIMETNDQLHVSNLLRGIQDGLHIPLSPMLYNGLESISDKLILILRNDEEFVAILRAKRAISEIDRQDILQETKEYKRNWNLIEAILRRSDYAFYCLGEALRETLQDNVAKYLHEGQVIYVHVNTTQTETDEVISDLLNETISEESKDSHSSDEKILTAINGYNIHPVAAKPGQSIVFFFYCQTVDNMIKFTELFISGELQDMIEVIMNRLLSKASHQNGDKLKARLSLDDAEILAIEKFSGIEDWLPVELKEATAESIILFKADVETQTIDQVEPEAEYIHEDEEEGASRRTVARYPPFSDKVLTELEEWASFSGIRAETRLEKMTSGSSGMSEITSKESGFYESSRGSHSLKTLEDKLPDEEDLGSSEYTDEGMGKASYVQEYVNRYGKVSELRTRSEQVIRLPRERKLPEDMYSGSSVADENYIAVREKLEKSNKEIERLKNLLEHQTQMIEKLEKSNKEIDRLKNLLEHQTQMSELPTKYKFDPLLVQTIRIGKAEKSISHIRGLAILGKQFFVVTERCSDVEVYASVNNYFSFRCRWNLKELGLTNPGSIASCKRNDCLYIIVREFYQLNQMLKIDPNGKLIRKWSTGEDYGYGLSVTDESNVILAVFVKKKLVEYSSDGQLIRKIDLSSIPGICVIRYAVQLTKDHFMVTYRYHSRGSREDQFTVSVVDSDGKVKKSFCEKCRSIIGEINSSNQLAVDGNGFVMVADYTNSRVLLLDSELEFKKELLSKEKHGLELPNMIHLDESNSQLYVSDNSDSGKIFIFEFK